MGPDPRAVVLILKSAYLHVKISVKVFRVYLGMVTSFWSTFVLGGGGGNVTFHGIYKLLNKRNPYLTSMPYYLDFGNCNQHYLVPNCSAINLEYITRNLVKLSNYACL